MRADLLRTAVVPVLSAAVLLAACADPHPPGPASMPAFTTVVVTATRFHLGALSTASDGELIAAVGKSGSRLPVRLAWMTIGDDAQARQIAEARASALAQRLKDAGFRVLDVPGSLLEPDARAGHQPHPPGP